MEFDRPRTSNCPGIDVTSQKPGHGILLRILPCDNPACTYGICVRYATPALEQKSG